MNAVLLAVEILKALLPLLQFPRTRGKFHSESQVERHLNLALRGLVATQYQVKDLVSVVNEQSQQIEKLMTKAKGQSEEMEALKVKVNVQAQQIKKLEQGKEFTQVSVPEVKREAQQKKWLDNSPSDSTSRYGHVYNKEGTVDTIKKSIILFKTLFCQSPTKLFSVLALYYCYFSRI